MAITPSTDLKLLKCDIELDNKNQLTFSNATAQFNYFNSLSKIEATSFSYLRKDNIIRYNAHIDDIINYNYVMYRNTNYSNKWFYAFITKMEYISDNVTFIYIETDCYQTWQFDLTFKRSFVEREHSSTDVAGDNIIDEGLELGEMVANGASEDIEEMKTCLPCLVISATPDPDDPNGGYLPGQFRGQLYSGISYEAYSPTTGTSNTGLLGLRNKITSYVNNGTMDRILGLIMIPKVLTNWDGSTDYAGAPIDSWSIINKTINRNSSIDGYTPKNKKLLTYPFNYLMLDNNSGITNIYHYELFPSSQPVFVIDITVGIGCSGICSPKGYKWIGQTNINWSEGIPTPKYAQCSFVCDSYTNYMSQNSLNFGVGAVANIGEVIAGGVGIASGSLAGAGLLASGIGGILSQIQQIHNAQFIPPRAEVNTNNCDVIQTLSKNTITFYKMSIEQNRAKIIDDYFSMFGYATKRVKVPNLSSRSKWNYIKTIDINITGDIPQDDMQKIKDMFNTGITLWHDSTHFLDYSQNNTIV